MKVEKTFIFRTGAVNAGVAQTLPATYPELASLIAVDRYDAGQYTAGGDIVSLAQTVVTVAPSGANEIQLSGVREITLNDACATSTFLAMRVRLIGATNVTTAA